MFRVDRRGLVLVGLGGGALVALFEVAYQYGIAGAGVAGAAALLYTAPVLVALLARPLLGEALTPLRLLLAVVGLAFFTDIAAWTALLLALGVAFGVVMGFIGGFFPAFRAARLQVVQALR